MAPQTRVKGAGPGEHLIRQGKEETRVSFRQPRKNQPLRSDFCLPVSVAGPEGLKRRIKFEFNMIKR